MKITEGTLNVFLAYAEDASNWSGMPLVGGNVKFFGEKIDSGHLTNLKKLGLITTFVYDKQKWIQFTPKGKDFALSHNIKIYDGK